MIDEILSLGFDHVELSHGIKLSLLPGIMRAVEAGKVQVAGVHNYFPAPIDEVGDAPDSRPFTADLPQVRAKAIELTKKSMEQGAALGAGYIVLHMGTVEPLVKRTDTAHLQSLARQGMVETESFAGTKGEFVRRRNRLAPVYLERAREGRRTRAVDLRGRAFAGLGQCRRPAPPPAGRAFCAEPVRSFENRQRHSFGVTGGARRADRHGRNGARQLSGASAF